MSQLDLFHARASSVMAPLDLDLPLPAGGRPLFDARTHLEKIAHHVRWQHAGAPLAFEETYTWILALRGLARALARAPFYRQGELKALDLWRQLPLFLDAPFVQVWEAGGWRLPELERDRRVQGYADLLDGEAPSMAYLPYGEPAKIVWEAWLRSSSVETLVQVLESSAYAWDAWHCRQPEHLRTHLIDGQRFQALAQGQGLPANLAGAWKNWERGVLAVNGSGQGQVWSAILKAVGSQTEGFFDVLAHAWQCPLADVEAVLGPSSPLVDAGIYLHLDPSRPYAFQKVQEHWGSHGYEWVGAAWQEVRSRVLSRHGRLTWNQLFPRVAFTAPDPAGPGRWTHLGAEFQHAQDALAHPTRPPAILIVGKAGQGKTTLVNDLVNHSQRWPGQPQRHEDPAKALPLAAVVGWAQWAPDAALAGVLVLDDDGLDWQANTDLLRLVRARRLPIIAATADASKISAELMGQFDQIITLSDLPLAGRLALAKTLFPEDAVALRVARTLRSADAIVRAAQWCAQVQRWDWATVQAFRLRQDQFRVGKGHRFEAALPLADEEGLPPQAGYAHLQAVANRLSRAFLEPERYAALRVAPPRGAILLGPPGTGKTLFARHLAARLQVPCFSPSVVELMKEPAQIRQLFAQARAQAPCVVLLDEAAQLIRSDGPCVQALLSELDGVDSLEGVLVIATSNHGAVHPALTRPGRLHEVHHIHLPEDGDRQQIWMAYLDQRPTHGKEPAWAPVLSRASRGLSGADIAEVIQRAAGDAVAEGESALSLERLVRACDEVAWSAPDGRAVGHEHEHWLTCVHEAGHALLAWRHRLEVQRITVRRREGALGMVAWDYPEDQHSFTAPELFGRIQMSLGGIVAEQVIQGHYSNGGSCDLQSVWTDLRTALTTYGFGHIGPVWAGLAEHWSDRRRQDVEDEVALWARQAFEEAEHWMRTHQDLLKELATLLREELDVSGALLDAWQTRVQAVADPRPLPPVFQPAAQGRSLPGGKIEGERFLEAPQRLHQAP